MEKWEGIEEAHKLAQGWFFQNENKKDFKA